MNVHDRVAVVEPGVINGDLQAAVEAQGLFYAPDPASLGFCSMGGNVAENAGGPRAFKYGVTRDWTLGMTMTLMGGETLRLGRRTPKGVTGYDLTALFVGSEGTFGVTSEITVRLVAAPRASGRSSRSCPTRCRRAARSAAIIRKGHRPRALELLDKASIDHVRTKAAFSFPADAGAIVLVELDGEPDGIEAAVLACGAVCEAEGARDVIIARDDADRERLWKTRRVCSVALREAYKFKLSEDTVVPPSSIPEMLRRVDAIGARHDLETATFGHAGDGNLHINLLSQETRRDAAVRGARRRGAGGAVQGDAGSRRHAVGRARHRHREGALHGVGAVAPRSSTGRSG